MVLNQESKTPSIYGEWIILLVLELELGYRTGSSISRLRERRAPGRIMFSGKVEVDPVLFNWVLGSISKTGVPSEVSRHIWAPKIHIFFGSEASGSGEFMKHINLPEYRKQHVAGRVPAITLLKKNGGPIGYPYRVRDNVGLGLERGQKVGGNEDKTFVPVAKCHFPLLSAIYHYPSKRGTIPECIRNAERIFEPRIVVAPKKFQMAQQTFLKSGILRPMLVRGKLHQSVDRAGGHCVHARRAV
ncbi:hypothetical protein C8R44DRAFT_726837 [Mycena epipterygia]|nr:hypothetical protein C8R44DRAFT_726837 [Mycena epipterygia]